MRIHIGPKTHVIQEVTGLKFRVYPLHIGEGNQRGYLQDRLDCSDVRSIVFVKHYQVLRVRWQRAISLPAPVHAAVVEFLQRWHAKQDLSVDCYAFACFVAGLVPQKQKSIWNQWASRRRRFRRKGDIVFLVNESPKKFHAAVYMGFGLYLSVWGAGGDLEVATLSAMKADFGVRRVIDVVPRSA